MIYLSKGGGRCRFRPYVDPPLNSDTFHQEISADLPGKEREQKRENGEKRRKILKKEKKKGKVQIWKWKEEKLQRGTYFFAFHFSKPLKFVLGLPKWEFSTRKKHFKPGKKSRKMTLPPLKNIPLKPACIAMWNQISHTTLCDVISSFWAFFEP